MCLTGIESRSPRLARAREGRVGGLDHDLDLAADEAQRVVRQQRAGQQAGLAQHLEAVADAEHRPAVAGELDHRLHHRREARDRADAQVVAVREAAGHDHGVDAGRGRGRRARAARRRRSAGRRAARRPRRRSRGSGRRRTSRRLLRRSRSPRSADSPGDARTSPEALPASSTSNSIRRPTCTFRTPSKPSAGSARSTACPCGSRMPSFGPNQHPRPHCEERSSQFGEGLTGDALVGLDVARAGALDDVVGQRRRRRALVPAGPRGPVAHELLVEARLPVTRLVAVGRPEARRVGREHLVARARSCRRRRRPNSNLVSARMIPRSRACAAPRS